MELPPLAPIVPPAIPPGASTGASTGAHRADPLRQAAESFEAVFLGEMLKHTGINAPHAGGFGGGAGEEAFASFLTQEYARLLAARGGLGLAERIHEALKARETGR